MNDSLIIYVEKEIFDKIENEISTKIENEDIMQQFQSMKSRQEQLLCT